MKACVINTICLLSLPVLSSCATVHERSQVSISLFPFHKRFLELQNPGVKITNIIDNDGNQYMNYWEVPIIDTGEFRDAVSHCDMTFNNGSSSARSPIISQFQREEIRPDNYKGYVSCIANSGYKMLDSKGYLPDGYNIQFSRSHSIQGSYIPVGGSIFIDGQGRPYTAMYDKVVECNKLYRQSHGNPAIEMNFRDYTYVSIKSYVENVMTCITGKPYLIAKNK